MVYTFLISIVFIAEIIIAIAIVQSLIKLDKHLVEIDATITETKPSVKEICELSHKISAQFVELSEDFVERTKEKSENIMLKQFSKFLIGVLVLNLNFKFIKKIRQSKFAKTLAKGLSLIENMV